MEGVFMGRRFEIRKREIEQDTKLNQTDIRGATSRLERYLEPYFRGLPRSETRENATTFVKGLLSDLRRKNTESIAYRFGKDRRGLQRFLGEVAWDDLAMRHRMVSQVVKLIGEDDGIIAEYEVQSWIGWHHHVTLCLLATWFLTKETIRIKKKRHQ
jgi:SRSO17 transposase